MAADGGAAGVEVGFLVLPSFSMMALSAATEPLRAANRLCGRDFYRVRLIGSRREPLVASNGFAVLPDEDLQEAEGLARLFVVAGLEVQEFADPAVMARLRRLAEAGVLLGAVSTGTTLLARAGLLEGRRCTVHWEQLAPLAAEFPDLRLCRDLYCLDGDRQTCAGGTAALDMMLAVIAGDLGRDLSEAVAEHFLFGDRRPGDRAQRDSVAWRFGVEQPRVVQAIELMLANVERPLPTPRIAAAVGVSDRHLERLFRQAFDKPPSRFYLELRLAEARRLLAESNEPIARVALLCGFSSASHLGRVFRELLDRTPGEVRRAALAAPPTPPAATATATQGSRVLSEHL